MRMTLDCLLAFMIAISIDYVYAKWLIAVTGKRRTAACIYSALCPLLGTLSLLVFLDHWITTFPGALGHALGTWIAMRHTHGPRPDA